jgi:hypothetical protein
MPKRRKEKTLIFMDAKKIGKLKMKLDVNEVLVKPLCLERIEMKKICS